MAELIAVLGPTASGKSSFAISLAQQENGEIIGADSVQIYRDLVIGSAAPSVQEREQVPHHLIGILGLDAEMNAGRFIRMARAAVEEVQGRGKTPILVGGTNFWVYAFLEGLSPVPELDEQQRQEIAAQRQTWSVEMLFAELQRIDKDWAAVISSSNDRQRIMRGLEVFYVTGTPLSVWNREPRMEGWPHPVKKIGLEPDRTMLLARIEQRTRAMLNAGLTEEVRHIKAQGFTPENCRVLRSIGYAEAFDYIEGKIKTEQDLYESVVIHTRQLAKRQKTWLKRDSDIIWRNL